MPCRSSIRRTRSRFSRRGHPACGWYFRNVLRQLVKVLVEVNDEKELREYQADQLKFKPKRRRDVKLTAEEMKELAALEDRGGKSKIDDTK